jgi:hypothetical protein
LEQVFPNPSQWHFMYRTGTFSGKALRLWYKSVFVVNIVVLSKDLGQNIDPWLLPCFGELGC